MKTKLIILLLSISLIYGCGSSGGGSGSNSAASTNPPTTPPPITTPAPTEPDATDDTGSPAPAPVESDIKIAANLGGNLYFLEDDNLVYKTSGEISQATTATFSVDSNLVTYDASGDPIETEPLPVVPTHIATANNGVFMCDEYDEQRAYDLGGLYRKYTEIYKDDVIISNWFDNQYECKDIVSVNDSVFVVDQNSGYRKISGPIDNVIHVENNQFVLSDWDSLTRTVKINGITESYNTNNILNARQWIEHDGLFYSENGYSWSEAAGLTELATALQAWQAWPYPVLSEDMPYGESPVLIKIGKYMDNLYWAECNTGWMFQYDPTNDTLVQKYRLYIGDGSRTSGNQKKLILNPVLTDNLLYFRDGGVIMKMDITTGISDIFYGGEGEIMEF